MTLIVNTNLVHTAGHLDMITQTLPATVTRLRPLGGSGGMWTFQEGKLPPEASTDSTLRAKLNIITDKMVEDYCALVKAKSLATIYMLNINDTVSNSLELLQKFVSGGANIEAVEIGQEMYLPKYRKNQSTAQGFVRKWTWAAYVAYCNQIVPQIRAMIPGVKILLHIASDNGNENRQQWNDGIEHLINIDPEICDGLVAHVYEGRNKQTEGEEAIVERADFKQFDRWKLPLYFTEAGNVKVNYTPEGLELYRDFHRRLYDYCVSRNDGSMPGTHVLYLRRANKGHIIYGPLYNEDGPLPLLNEIAGFPWKQTEAIAVKIWPDVFFIWGTQVVQFSDGTSIQKRRNWRNRWTSGDVGKPKSYFSQ